VGKKKKKKKKKIKKKKKTTTTLYTNLAKLSRERIWGRFRSLRDTFSAKR
jgi:hypothetical protein